MNSKIGNPPAITIKKNNVRFGSGRLSNHSFDFIISFLILK